MSNILLIIFLLSYEPSPPYRFFSNGVLWVFNEGKTEVLIHSYPHFIYYSLKDSIHYNLVIPFINKPDSVKIFQSTIFDEISYISEPVRVRTEDDFLKCSCYKIEDQIGPQPETPPYSYKYEITQYFITNIIFAENIDSLINKLDLLGYNISVEQETLLSEYLNENFKYFVALMDTYSYYFSYYKSVIKIYFPDSVVAIPVKIISQNPDNFYFFTIGTHRTYIEKGSILYAEKISSRENNYFDSLSTHFGFFINLNEYSDINTFITSFKLDSIPLFLRIKRAPEDTEFQKVIYTFFYFTEPVIILTLLLSFFFLRPKIYPK